MENKEYFTTNELAKLLGISHVAVYKKIKNKQIKAQKIGRNFIIFKKDIDDVLGDVISDKLTEKTKEKISLGVDRVVKEYGEVLQKLGKE